MVLGAGNALDLLATHSRGRFDGFDCGDDGGDGGLLVTRERLFDKIRKGNLTYPRYLSEHAQGILHGVREREYSAAVSLGGISSRNKSSQAEKSSQADGPGQAKTSRLGLT